MISHAGKRDAIYARYSSRKQEDGTSIEVQLEACRHAVEGECREYVDKARTGRSIAGRPRLLRLIDDAEAGLVGRLFVYKFDRLGRAAETHGLVADLEECGVEVISVTEGKESLSRGVQLVVAEHYSKSLAERTHAGLMKRFENREWTGGSPSYGLTVVDDDGKRRLAVNSQEAEVVRQVFAWYLGESVGVKEIARRLREKAMPTRKGGDWTFTTVRRILVNPSSTGVIRYNARKMRLNKTTGRRVPQFKDESKHVQYQDESLRIVSDADFTAVQKRLEKRSRKGKTARPSCQVRPFSGLLFCDECGRPFYSRRSRNKKGDYRYYACSTRQRLGLDACSCKKTLREDLLMHRIQEAISFAFDDADAVVEMAIEEATKSLNSNRGEAVRLQREMRTIEMEIARLGRELVNPDANAAAKKAILNLMGEGEKERERLERALSLLTEQTEDGTDGIAATVESLLERAKTNLSSVATPTQFNRFVESFIGLMCVTAEGEIKPLVRPGENAGRASLDPHEAIRAAFWSRFEQL